METVAIIAFFIRGYTFQIPPYPPLLKGGTYFPLCQTGCLIYPFEKGGLRGILSQTQCFPLILAITCSAPVSGETLSESMIKSGEAGSSYTSCIPGTEVAFPD